MFSNVCYCGEVLLMPPVRSDSGKPGNISSKCNFNVNLFIKYFENSKADCNFKINLKMNWESA